jgi:hypothetical protein
LLFISNIASRVKLVGAFTPWMGVKVPIINFNFLWFVLNLTLFIDGMFVSECISSFMRHTISICNRRFRFTCSWLQIPWGCFSMLDLDVVLRLRYVKYVLSSESLSGMSCWHSLRLQFMICVLWRMTKNVFLNKLILIVSFIVHNLLKQNLF